MTKQNIEKDSLMKKTNATESELQKDKNKEINRINHKNENTMKDLKSQQEKEILAQKGQIKSKVTVSAVKSKSKIVLNQHNEWYCKKLFIYPKFIFFNDIFNRFYPIFIFLIFFMFYSLWHLRNVIKMQEFYKVPDEGTRKVALGSLPGLPYKVKKAL